MVSFTQVLLTISAAGIILGRQEIVQISRLLGKGVGTLVGFMQGMRVKLEQASKDSGMHELHQDVRRGLEELSTVRSELTMTTGRYGGRFVGQTVWNEGSATTAATTPIIPVTPSVTTQTRPTERQPVAPVTFATEQMARMIMAQEQLSSDRFFNPRIERQSSGADIVTSAISESILSEYLVANQESLLKKAPGASAQPNSKKPEH